MIPVSLAMRNFMCYHDDVPPLRFDGFHVACLCGDNGHGKSALLDAITWALWGRSRAKSDDDLIHLGESEMEVEFEFLVGDTRYRVLRKRTKSGLRRPGQSLLELQVATDKKGYTPISGNTIAETQQKLLETLRMDYQTFINSALLLQGHADEFTTKGPAERKKVLGDILDLQFYADLEELAKSHSKLKDNERSRLEGELAEIDEELAGKDEYERELQEVQDALAQLQEEVKAREAELGELRQAKKVLDLKAEQIAETKRRIKAEQAELAALEEQLEEHHAKIKEYEDTLAQRHEVEEGYSRLLAAREENEGLNHKLSQLVALNERRNKLNEAVQQAKGNLERERAVLASDLDRLEAQSKKVPRLEEELAKAQAVLDTVPQLEERLTTKRNREQELSNLLHQLRTANAQLKEEMNDLKAKIDMLPAGEARCPLCEAELGEEGRERIVAKYQAEGQARGESFRANEQKLRELDHEYQSLKVEASQLEAQIGKERADAQGRSLALRKELDEASEAAAELSRLGPRLAEIDQRLRESRFALPEQEELAQVAAQTAKLDYDAKRHQEVRDRLTELEGFDALHRRLEEAARLIGQERTGLSRTQDALARRRDSLATDAQKEKALAAEVAAAPELSTKLAQAQQVYDALASQQAWKRELLGATQQKLEHCAYLEGAKEDKAGALARAMEEKSIYDELAVAFGKKGVQALIIESVLPEVEEEATRLLGRMTDNRMHLKIETQRPKKTRKEELAETLEIRISDELGTRNYEMYSGGEAFRINLALRIALSKLLARRAGAPLSTLIIDEGFGTQDSSGLEKLVEAINSIQDDFEKIIVITHIQEIKDRFQTLIEVTKTPRGSTLTMS